MRAIHAMASTGEIILRYFPVCGRAQPLRHALLDAGVGFEDERIPLADWPARKDDPTMTGPYRSLPTLRWGDALIAETLPIASYVAHRLGHHDGLDQAARARLDAVVSCCYVDVTLPMGVLIWADLAWPGVDLERAWPAQLGRMLEKLALVSQECPGEGFLGGARPVMADFYADEAYATLRYVLGRDREPALRERFPRLASLHDRVSARPRLAGARSMRPAQFTSRPDEATAVERLRAVDLSALGL